MCPMFCVLTQSTDLCSSFGFFFRYLVFTNKIIFVPF